MKEETYLKRVGLAARLIFIIPKQGGGNLKEGKIQRRSPGHDEKAQTGAGRK
jgi:hypothetical protein